MSTPFFSIIIPVYNVESYISECLDSVLNQTYKNYEVIIVNDGSTDNTLEVCNSYRSIDERIIVLDGLNSGAAYARNKGLDYSKGKYIFFIDGDDHLEKSGTALLKIFNLLIQSDVDILLLELIPFDSGSKLEMYSKSDLETISSDKMDFIFDNNLYFASPCNKITKRNLIYKNNITFPVDTLAEDIKWCGDLIKVTDNILYHNLSFYFYRQERHGSATYTLSKTHIMNIYKQIKNEYENTRILNNEYLNIYYSLNYLNCLRLMCISEDFSTNEIKKLMKPLKSYLNINDNYKFILIKNTTRFLGFKNVIRLLKTYFRNER